MFSVTVDVVRIVWSLALLSWRSIDFLATKVIVLYFQPLQGLHVSLQVKFYASDHALLLTDACIVPENCVHAVSSRRLSPDFFLPGRSGVIIFK
jgi:hypothetical protein